MKYKFLPVWFFAFIFLNSCVMPKGNSDGDFFFQSFDSASLSDDGVARYLIGSASVSGVKSVDVEWISGSVNIVSYQGNEILFEESSSSDSLPEDFRLRYWQEGNVLHIRFCKSGKVRMRGIVKKLTVKVPVETGVDKMEVETSSADIKAEKLKCQQLEVSSVSGNILVSSVHVREASVISSSGDVRLSHSFFKEVEAHTVSGILLSEDCHSNEMEAETSSGDIKMSATLSERFEVESVSGNIRMEEMGFFDRLEAETSSGDIELSLSDKVGFTMEAESASGKVSVSKPVTFQQNRYRFGDGKATLKLESVSGDISVK